VSRVSESTDWMARVDSQERWQCEHGRRPLSTRPGEETAEADLWSMGTGSEPDTRSARTAEYTAGCKYVRIFVTPGGQESSSAYSRQYTPRWRSRHCCWSRTRHQETCPAPTLSSNPAFH
jgi:hypothetical protein